MNNKDIIFVSHSNPFDNDFARWLSLKLINLGYKVWSDVIKLQGGNYTWGEIENVIRNRTAKFIFVTSRNSNQAEGCINELSVSDAVKRENNYRDFIIPLKIDDLPFTEMNIYINKLFAIDCTKNWAEGLKGLLEKLKEDNVPQSSNSNPEYVSNWWNTAFMGGKTAFLKNDRYLSNWFSILEFPEYINFHKFGRFLNSKIDIRSFKYPAISFSNYLATFAYCFDFMDDLPKSAYYSPKDTIAIKTKDIFEDSFSSTFIQHKEAKNILTQLLKLSWERKMAVHGLLAYELANEKKCYFLKNNFNETNRIGRIKLVGNIRERFWHYAVSCYPKYYPEFAFGIKAHIIFSDDGETFIDRKKAQHTLRRKLGKNWWNFHWREKLNAMIQVLSEKDTSILFNVGSEEKIIMDTTPVYFDSMYSYEEPVNETANLEDNIDTNLSYEDIEEEEDEEFDERLSNETSETEEE